MAVKVKICGINSLESLNASILYGADFVGFVFVEKSPRYVTPDYTASLCKNIKNSILKVGLFVNPTNNQLEETLKKTKLDYIQLHGLETKERIIEIKKLFSTPVIKAVSVNDANDINKTKDFYNIADIILFDALAPKNAEISGGNGITFDWNLLKNIPENIYWGLAGGLNPENVKNAIQTTNAKLVDVSSGVESQKGLKNCQLIENFIKEAKNA